MCQGQSLLYHLAENVSAKTQWYKIIVSGMKVLLPELSVNNSTGQDHTPLWWVCEEGVVGWDSRITHHCGGYVKREWWDGTAASHTIVVGM